MGPADVAAALGTDATVEALRRVFQSDVQAPQRHHHHIAARSGGSDGTMLLMPAWDGQSYLGVKVVNVFPDNGALGLPAVQGVYLLFNGRTGVPLATIDGGELTARRTAAASALAASYLARADAENLLVVGTGRLSFYLAAAHAAVRTIRRIAVWGRDPAKASSVVVRLRAAGHDAEVSNDLAASVAGSDIISCATLSRTPLVRGEWLRPGTHLDLVGGFTPQMRETDDTAIRRSSVFIDTKGARVEAGDIAAPLASGALQPGDIRGDLYALTRGMHPGRVSESELTLFKSVGAAEEDLAAAILAYEHFCAAHPSETVPGPTTA